MPVVGAIVCTELAKHRPRAAACTEGNGRTCFWGTISATMVLKIPTWIVIIVIVILFQTEAVRSNGEWQPAHTFPLTRPESALENMAIGRVVENP